MDRQTELQSEQPNVEFKITEITGLYIDGELSGEVSRTVENVQSAELPIDIKQAVVTEGLENNNSLQEQEAKLIRHTGGVIASLGALSLGVGVVFELGATNYAERGMGVLIFGMGGLALLRGIKNVSDSKDPNSNRFKGYLERSQKLYSIKAKISE